MPYKKDEEVVKEFDKNEAKWLSPDPIEPQYMIPDMRAIKSFLLQTRHDDKEALLKMIAEWVKNQECTPAQYDPDDLYLDGIKHTLSDLLVFIKSLKS